MLFEIKNAKKFDHEKRVRWFSDEYFDLAVWFDNADGIDSFQLTYNKYRDPHVLSWTHDGGYLHEAVDDGEVSGRFKKSPVLMADGIFPGNEIAERFKLEAAELNREIADFVYEKIKSYDITD